VCTVAAVTLFLSLSRIASIRLGAGADISAGRGFPGMHDRIVEDDLALPLTRPSLSRQVCQTLGRAGLAAYELMLTRAVGQLLSRLRAAVRECPGWSWAGGFALERSPGSGRGPGEPIFAGAGELNATGAG